MKRLNAPFQLVTFFRYTVLASVSIFLSISYTCADEFRIQDLSAGLYSYPSSNQIPDNACADIQNFYTDIEKSAVERRGYEKRDSTILGGTQAVTGLWEFTDSTGNKWIISFSSRSFYKNTVGETPIKFGQNPSSDAVPDCASNIGKFWCVNGSDSLWYFDGTSTATVAGAPVGSLIEAWRNRIVIGNIGSSQSTLRFSADGDGTSWALAGNPTDPFSVEIGGANDGFNITCLWGSFQDNLIAARKSDIWAGSGFDQADFEIRAISKEVGCVQTGTMREVDGSLIFMSNRGLEEMQGYTIRNISEPIRNITDELVKNTASSRSQTLTSQADFADGSISPSGHLSTIITAGSVVLSSYAITETSNADFNLGTCSNCEIQNNQILISTNNGNMANYDIESGNWASSPGLEWVRASGVGGDNCGSLAPRSGSWVLSTTVGGGASYTVTPSLIDSVSGATLITGSAISWADNSCTWTARTLAGNTAHSRKNVRMRFTRSNDNATATGEFFIYNGQDITFYTASDQTTAVNFNTFAIDDATNGASTISTGAFTSRTYDTGISTNMVHVSSVGITINGYSPVVSLQRSHNGSTWVTITTTPLVNVNGNRYMRYVASFTVTGASSAFSSLNDVSIIGVGTGTYTSPIISIGGLISSWGALTIDSANNNGTLQFQFNASSSPTVAEFNASSWTTVVSGNIPTNGVNAYAIFRASFNVTASTHVPILNSFTVSWNEGGTTQPLTSWNFDRRYWLAFTTNTASGAFNDRVLLYQRNKSFTLFNGINAASFATWRDNLYFGNSNDTGYVYKFDVGNSDDGADITSFIRTKSYDLGVPERDKDLSNVFVNFLGNATAFTGMFSLSYDLDRSGANYSLGSANLSEGTGLVSGKFPFALSNPVQGREIQYVLTKSGTGDRLKLYSLKTNFSLLEEP